MNTCKVFTSNNTISRCTYEKYRANLEHFEKENSDIGYVIEDSRSDSCLLSQHFHVTEYTMQRVTLVGYRDEFEKPSLRIGHGVTAYYGDAEDQIILIGIRNAIIVGDDQRNMLLCPNQIRTYGGQIDCCPKFLSQGKSIHGIKIMDE
jgi:hypothetical protein